MKHEEKKKKVLSIADELDRLGYTAIAKMLRDAVNSRKDKSNEQSESNEGDDDTGGSNPGKEKPPKP